LAAEVDKLPRYDMYDDRINSIENKNSQTCTKAGPNKNSQIYESVWLLAFTAAVAAMDSA